MENEHLVHNGVIVVGSGVSIAFGMMDLSRMLFLIIAIGSATKVLIGGVVVASNRSGTSRNASE